MLPLIALVLILATCGAIKIYLKLTTGWCKSRTCLLGKTALITGANSGIGYETALDFAKRGARVILACRSPAKAEEARSKIISETGNENIVVKNLDMASFASVRAFAKEINETENRLDILVNNAGMIGRWGETTEDGLPVLMQTNHFSGFLLTNLLVNLLKQTQGRIVNVSSVAARRARDFTLEKIVKQNRRFGRDYAYSKLCNILFTQELARRLQGTGVTAYSLHPGVVKTNFFDNTSAYFKILVAVLLNLFSKTSEEGAQTTIYCSVTKGLEGFSGEHFSDCKRIEPYKTAREPGLARKLWEKSEEIVNL
ncbi:retinol dehydrogenase 11 [Tribolium castaneum]|uniref:WW domain-containing oxidoreductase-like Protein n=1 Tax=Tribolium castaneum TaxID=7070 RepID=D6X0A9_TRICA|nr:PREDICTED: retinol dehydrogenase 11 [Tribolium castaneum]EFA09601.1 WW domain-containing oxidoreductase-like Protein [Tribolium castaneum]|eukprot:XP_967196.1 PREDICTED: retinol dehydrogenase 11 [Tribolium castaneum]